MENNGLEKRKSAELILMLANCETPDHVKFNILMVLNERFEYLKDRAVMLSNNPSPLKGLRKSKKCAFCSSSSSLTVDHIKPKSRGGANTIDNVQTLCTNCNGMKGSKYPYTKEDMERENENNKTNDKMPLI